MKRYFPAFIVGLVVCISELTFLPMVVRVILDLITLTLANTCNALIYKYYGSLMETHQTLITYMVRLLMITGGILNLNYILVRDLHDMFPERMESWYRQETQLACSLFTSMVPSVIFLTNLFFVLVTKGYMMLHTLHYLGLDHEKLAKVLFCTIVGINAGEFTVLFLRYGTLCPKGKLENIRTVYKINLPEDTPHTPAIVPFHILILIVPEVIFRLSMLLKRRKKRAILRVPQRIVSVQRRLTLIPSKIKSNNFMNQISPHLANSNHLSIETNSSELPNQMYLTAKKSTKIMPIEEHSSSTSGIGNFGNTQSNAVPSCSTDQAFIEDDKADKPQILTVTEVNELSERQINKPNLGNNACSSINSNQYSIISLSNETANKSGLERKPKNQNPECGPQILTEEKLLTKSLNTTSHPFNDLATRSAISVRPPSTRRSSAVQVMKMKTNLTVALCLFLALLNIIFLVSGINILM